MEQELQTQRGERHLKCTGKQMLLIRIGRQRQRVIIDICSIGSQQVICIGRVEEHIAMLENARRMAMAINAKRIRTCTSTRKASYYTLM